MDKFSPDNVDSRQLRSAFEALLAGQVAPQDFLAWCASSIGREPGARESLLAAAQELSADELESIRQELGEQPIAATIAAAPPDSAAGADSTGADPAAADPTAAESKTGQDTPVDPTVDFSTSGSGTGAAAGSIRVPSSQYTLREVHAEGGMGKVWKAEDESLGRIVALKDLHDRGAKNERLRNRFVKEARITGQLEHPNIVPLYHLGEMVDSDRPFYTMRMITGRTLTEEVERYHKGSDTEGRTHTLRRLVQALVAVGNAISYAHSRKVIHRDLKGHNIVLGPFGEVVVLDWGVARLLDEEEPAASALSGGSETSEADSTQEGQLVGTPAFMAPEQARGETGAVDERTDVYGLGAILYQILTGQGPFRGPTVTEVLERVRLQPPTPPHEVSDQAPRPLEAICLKALAKAPEDRYQNAGDLVAELQRWLDDEPVEAYPEPALVRAGRWARKHRTLVTSAAVLLLTAVVGLGVSNVLITRQEALTDAARKDAEENYQRAEELRVLAQSNFTKAREAVDTMLTKLGQERLRNIPQLENVRKELLEEALEFNESLLEVRSDDPELQLETARSYTRIGRIQHVLGDREAAKSNFRMAIGRVEDIVRREPASPRYRHSLQQIKLDYFQTLERAGELQQAEKLANEARSALEEMSADFPEIANIRVTYANSLIALASIYDLTDRPEKSLQAYDTALDVRREILGEDPNDPTGLYSVGLINGNIGNLHYRRHEYEKAEAPYRLALDAKRKLLETNPKEIEYQERYAMALIAVGNVLQETDRVLAAERHFLEAAPILEQLREGFPSFVKYRRQLAAVHYNLGNLNYLRRRMKAAEAPYRRALAIHQGLVEDYPADPEFSQALISNRLGLANVLQYTGRADEAEQEFVALLEHAQQTVKDDADRGRWLSATCQYNLGNLHIAHGDASEAEQHYRQATKLIQELEAADPENSEYQEMASSIALDLGNLLQQTFRYPEALQAFQTCIQRLERLHERYPLRLTIRYQLAKTQNNLGNLMFAAQQDSQSQAGYEAAREILAPLVEQHPESVDYLDALASAQLGLGNLLQNLNKYKEAEAKFHAVLELCKTIRELQPENEAAHRRPGIVYFNLGNLMMAQERLEDAEPHYRRALEIQTKRVEADPENVMELDTLASITLNLGNQAQYSGRLEEAQSLFEETLQLDERMLKAQPGRPPSLMRQGTVHYNLGNLLRQSGRYEKVADAYQQSIESQKRLAAAIGLHPLLSQVVSAQAGGLNNLARHLADCPDPSFRDPQAGLDAINQALRLAPEKGEWVNTKAICHYRLGDWKASLADLEKSMQLRDGGDAIDWYFVAMVHHQLGDSQEASQWLARAITWQDEHDAENATLLRYHEEAKTLGIKPAD